MERVVGWVCTYTPEEVILAAGCRPWRLYGAGEGGYETALLPRNLCPYARSCLGEALAAPGPGLAGVVLAASCHAVVHLANAIREARREDSFPVFLLDVPRPRAGDPGSPARSYYASCLARLAGELADLSGAAWDREGLRRASSLLHEVRLLLRELYSLLRAEPPRLRATGVLQAVRYAAQAPKEEAVWVLKEVVEFLRAPRASPRHPRAAELAALLRREVPPSGPRLVLAGSPLPLEYVSLREEVGGVVVADDLCQGYRYCLPEVGEVGDLEELAEAYLHRLPCPRMLALEERLANLAALVESSRAAGLVYHCLKFCDSSLYESVQVRSYFRERGIPILCLESDYRGGSSGQVRTRLEAFLEML